MKQITVLLLLLIFAGMTGCANTGGSQTSALVSPSATILPTPSPTALLTPSPTSPFAIELTELPEEYQPEEAAANGDYVSVHGKQIYNEEKLNVFLGAVADKKDAAIRVVQYTVEGDPIITDVIFSDNKFIVWADTTRDKFGIKKIEQYEYKNLIEYEQDDQRIFVYLTDENEITKDMLENGFDGYLLTVSMNTPSLASD